MLETNQTRGPSAEYGLRASVTMRGPCGEMERQKTRFPKWREQPGPISGETQALDGTPSSIPSQPAPYQVRATNADVDDVRDGLARVPFPFTAPDTLAQSREMSSAQTPEYKLLFKSIITSVSLHLSSNFPALREAY